MEIVWSAVCRFLDGESEEHLRVMIIRLTEECKRKSLKVKKIKVK